jgi:hypothetical protein
VKGERLRRGLTQLAGNAAVPCLGTCYLLLMQRLQSGPPAASLDSFSRAWNLGEQDYRTISLAKLSRIHDADNPRAHDTVASDLGFSLTQVV